MHIVSLIVALAFTGVQERLAGVDLPMSILTKAPERGSAVVKVDGQPITVDEIQALLYDWKRDEVVSELIDDRIIRAAAAKQNLVATDADLQQAYDKLMVSITQSLPPGTTIDQAMAQQHLTKSLLWLRIRSEFLLRKLILKTLVKDDFVKISTMVVKPASPDTGEVRKALNKADTLYKRLQLNESWEKVFASSDHSPNDRSGLVGWRTLKAFPETVQKELVGLKKGQFTRPAQTSNGIQIFRLEAIGRQMTADEQEELENAYFAGKSVAYLNELRKAAKVEKT